jgi:hypothetical protein
MLCGGPRGDRSPEMHVRPGAPAARVLRYGFVRYFAWFTWFIWLASARVLAQSDSALSVERGGGSEDCPDADSLGARVAAIRGAPTQTLQRYAVRFERDATEYSALIRSGTGDALVRRIAAPGSDCAALAQATALTLALLFDADGARPASQVATPAPVVPLEPQPAAAAFAAQPERPLAVARTASGAARRLANLTLGAGSLLAVVRPVAPAFVADGGMTWARLRFALGALWVSPQRSELGPGSVVQSLLSGRARLCYAPILSNSVRVDLCSGYFVGELHASARGFTRNLSESRLFSALPLTLDLLQFGRHFGWQLDASLLVPFRRNQFGIDELGAVYRPGAVALLFTLSGVGLLGF